jgi:hypothetical protein
MAPQGEGSRPRTASRPRVGTSPRMRNREEKSGLRPGRFTPPLGDVGIPKRKHRVDKGGRLPGVLLICGLGVPRQAFRAVMPKLMP